MGKQSIHVSFMAIKTKSALDIIREERERFEAKVREQKDALFHELQDLMKSANELCKGLIAECKETPATILQLPTVDEFVSRLLAKTTLVSVEQSGRVKRADLETAILKAVDAKELTHAEIKASPELVQVYQAISKPVPNLFAKLDALGKAKKLLKSGDGKQAKYKVQK